MNTYYTKAKHAIAAFVLMFGLNVSSQAQTSPYIGINVYSPSTYDPTRPLADVIRSSADTWKDVDFNNDAPADANGWPLSDGTIMLWENLAGNQGTYKLKFTGQATVSQQFGYFTFANIVYDQASNTTTMDAIVTDQGKQNCILKFTNTKLTPGSPTNSGIKNVQFMRPTSPGATTSYAFNENYTTQYKHAISKYSVFRFMAGTNANSSVNWSDRTRIDENSQNKVLPNEGSEANGMSWELKVALCNELGKDMWVNIPLNANDNYIQQLVSLLKNGATSDGVFYPGLNSGLKLYVELSNELWNFGGSDFKQSNQLIDIATAAVAAGNTTINYDGETNIGVLRFRQQAKRTKEISEFFRAGFGDDQMITRVRPLLEFQYANYNSSALIPLEFLNNYYNNADGVHVTNPHPVNYYLYGAGGATYYYSENDNASTVDSIFNSGIPKADYQGILEGEAVWPRAYGLHVIAYEGGMGVGGDRTSGARTEARSDPRAKAAEVTSFNMFRQAGGDLYVFGTYAQWEDIYNSDASPLQQGVDQINASTAPSPTFGTLVSASAPTLITTQSVDLSPGGSATIAFSNNNIMQGYVYRITTAGDYQIKLRVGNQATGGKIAVYVDGLLKNTIDVPVTGAGTADVIVATVALSIGQHGVLVKPIAAPASSPDRTARMVGVVFIPGGSGTTDTQAPSIPSNLSSSNITQNGFTLNWTASSDNSSGIAGYDVFDGATKLNSSDITGSSYVVTGLTCNTTHNITMKAKDGAGNISPASAGLNVSTQACSGSGSGSTVVVRARSIGTGANLTLEVIDQASATGGTVQQTQTSANISTSFNDYTFNLTGTVQANRIRVRFANDNNNDLEVDYIIMDGTTYQTEDITTYSVGNYNAGPNGCINAGYFQVSVLHCNGYFQYNLGSAPSSATYLSDLNWTAASSGYGTVQKDKTIDGNGIKLNGTTYAKGIGTHATSTITYNLGGNYNAFISDIGLDDEVDAYSCGLVVFQVYLDGTLAYTSSPKGNTTVTEAVNLNVTGKTTLRLDVTDAGNGNSCDHADWANARVTSGSGARRGVNETAIASQIDVFPNPSSGTFYVVVGEEVSVIDILDLQGKLITSKSASNQVTFNNGDLNKGVYIVKVTNVSGVTIRRLVIE